MLNRPHPYLPTYIAVINGVRFFSTSVAEIRQRIANGSNVTALYLVRNGRTIALPIRAI